MTSDLELIKQSESYNGYLREEAVSLLEKYSSASVVEALLVRSNDWVPQVRDRAKTTLINMISETTAAYYIENLDKLEHLRYCGRTMHTSFIRQVKNKLKCHPLALANGIKVAKSNSAYIAAKVLAKIEHFDNEKLQRLCIESPHEKLRLYGITLSQKLPEDIQTIVFLSLLQDKSARLRRESLRALNRVDIATASKAAESLLFDKHPGVRSLAIHILKSTDFKCVAVYSAQLQNQQPKRACIAIWGLMDLLEKEKLNEIKPHLNSIYPSVRLQALKACFLFEIEENLAALSIQMLNDSSTKTVKETARLADKFSVNIPMADLVRILDYQSSTKIYGILLKLSHKINKWDQLILLSRLSATNNGDKRNHIIETLYQWSLKMSHFFIDPSHHQQKLIHSLSRKETKLWTKSTKNIVNQRFTML